MSKSKFVSQLVLSLAVASFAGGCAFDAEPSAGEEVVEQSDALSRTMARVDIDASTFVEFNVHEDNGVVVGTEVVEQGLASEAPPLARPSLEDATLLELFRAISRDEAPAELVEMHRATALERGRNAQLVRPVTFDRNVLKSAYSTTGCTNWVLETWNLNPVIQNNLNLSVLSFSDVWSYNILSNPTGSGVVVNTSRVGVCADSSSASMQHKYTYRQIGASSWSTFVGEVSAVAGGTARRITSEPSVGWQRRVKVGGAGTDFHMRTGHVGYVRQ